MALTEVMILLKNINRHCEEYILRIVITIGLYIYICISIYIYVRKNLFNNKLAFLARHVLFWHNRKFALRDPR